MNGETRTHEENQAGILDGLIDNLNLAEQNDSRNRELLRSWLGRTMKIVITDGRIIIGSFICTDRHGNIILENSREFWYRIDGK